MSLPILGSFIDKKKADSDFLSLADGESCRVTNLREVKMVTKTGMGGEEKDVLRYICDVETNQGLRLKKFDNSSQSFAMQVAELKIDIGSAFTLTRTGQGLKTKYVISEVVNPTPAAAV